MVTINEAKLRLQYGFYLGVALLLNFFGSFYVRVLLVFGLCLLIAATALRASPAFELPVEVPEEAKLMCANSVGLKTVTAVAYDTSYLVKAACINGDVIYREIRVEKGG